MRPVLPAGLLLLAYATCLPAATAQCVGCEQGVREGTVEATAMSTPRNVLGTELQPCSLDPLTGWFRDGSCRTDDMDHGTHVVCARMTAAFLEFSAARGNDLVTPRPAYRFPGLNPGDQWCLCAVRWKEAYDAGLAPGVVLEGTHERALGFVTLEALRSHAVPADDPDATNPVDN